MTCSLPGVEKATPSLPSATAGGIERTGSIKSGSREVRIGDDIWACHSSVLSPRVRRRENL
jgi:hypothetical protein